MSLELLNKILKNINIFTRWFVYTWTYLFVNVITRIHIIIYT